MLNYQRYTLKLGIVVRERNICFEGRMTHTNMHAYIFREGGNIELFITLVPKVLHIVLLFVASSTSGLLLNFDLLVVETFQPQV